MKKLALVLGLFVTAIGVKAQMYGAVAGMAALNSGDIATLDNVKLVNIAYDYSEAGVGAYRKEQDYLEKRSAEMNEKKPGTGDKMVQGWQDGKKNRYEPKFEELFSKYGKDDLEMEGKNYATTNDVTLLVKTTFIEPGVNVGVYKKPAYVDMECIFKDKTGKELVSFFVKNCQGSQAMGFDYDVSSRLVESYAKAAKTLVGAIAKERKKAAKKK
jgi:hypothetical protein